MMDKLPLELLTSIFEETNLDDVRNSVQCYWKHNVRNSKMAAACSSRWSCVTYLRKYFQNPIELLDAMAATRCYISGSIAAEFFVKGCATPDSDIDFYIKNDAEDVSRFMKYMESIGTTWQSNIHKITKILLERSGTIEAHGWELHGAITAAKFCGLQTTGVKYLFSCDYDNLSEDLTTQEYQRYRFISRLRDYPQTIYNVKFMGNKLMFSFKTDETGASYAGVKSIIAVHNGTLTVKNKSTESITSVKVQLVICDTNATNEFEPVMGFHSTCIQAVIGPFSAVHFYYELTKSKKAYLWVDNCTGDGTSEERQDRLRNKYISRGFEYEDPGKPQSSMMNIRTAKDCQSMFVSIENGRRFSRAAIEMVQRQMSETAWYECGNTVSHVPITIWKALGYGFHSPFEHELHHGVFTKYDIEYCEKYGISQESTAVGGW